MSRRPAASPTAVTPRALPGLDQPGLDQLTPDQVIDELHQQHAAAHQAEVREIELAISWALLHPCPEDATPASWGEGRSSRSRSRPSPARGADHRGVRARRPRRRARGLLQRGPTAAG